MRLLLVEDSVRLRALLTERIRGAGWMLDAVPTMAAATAAARSILYDLILVDGYQGSSGDYFARVRTPEGRVVYSNCDVLIS